MSRRAVCIGVPTCVGDDDLPFVRERVPAVAAALQRFAYDVSVHVEPAELTGAGLAGLIRRSVEEQAPTDLLIVHLVGHARHIADGALYVLGTDGKGFGRIDEWVRQFADFPESYPTTLLLLDVCYPGASAGRPWQLSTVDRAAKCWVLAACAERGPGFQGRFSRAVAGVLDTLAGADAHVDAGAGHVALDTVARLIRREVKRLVDEENGYPQEVIGSLHSIAADPPDVPFFPNPRGSVERSKKRPRVDIALQPFLDDVDEALDPVFFMERASGRLDGGQGPGCFSGRRRELRALTNWCNGDSQEWLRVVTGSPGAGKSALIGVTVCKAHPDLTVHTRRLWENVEWSPRVNRQLAAVHARQRGLTEIVASLARQLGLAVDGGVQDFLDRVAERRQPPVIVVDALDEAEQCERVMNRLLLPLVELTRPDGAPACRLLVGMRPWARFAPLREAAERMGGLTDLDTVDRRTLREDLDGYVQSLLRSHDSYRGYEYGGPRGAFAASVANTLTQDRHDDGQRWGEFLVAGLYTYHFTAAYAPIGPDDNARARELGGAVPLTLPALLDVDLSVRDNPWLRPVLTALAYAQGDGMPAEVIYDAATAFGTGEPARSRVVDALGLARFYLRAAADTDGTTLYRLFHQGLADYLRRGRASGPELARAILAPLRSMDSDQEQVRCWEVAGPYLLRHAAAHCVEGDAVELLDDDVEFLVYADPTAVATVLDRASRRWLDPAEYRRIRDAGSGPDARRFALACLAVLRGAGDVAERLCHSPGRLPPRWQPIWADTPTPVDTPATADIPALTGTPATVDTPVPIGTLATVDTRMPVDVAPRVGASTSLDIPTSVGAGSELAEAPSTSRLLLRDSGRPYALLATAPGRVSVWRLDLDRPLWTVTVPGPVRRLRFAGRSRTVIADDRRIGWHLDSGAPVPESDWRYGAVRLPKSSTNSLPATTAPGDTEPAPAYAWIDTEKGTVWAVGDRRGGIKLYRLNGESWIPAGWQPTRERVRALAGIADGPRLMLVHLDGDDVVVTVRNLRKGSTESYPLGRVPGVRELQCLLIGGDLVVLASGARSHAWRWRRPPNHAPMDTAVATTAVTTGSGVVAIGGSDGTVRVRDTRQGTVVHTVRPHRDPVTALAFGGDLIVSAGAAGDLAVSDPTEGVVFQGPASHGTAVTAVGLVELGDRRLVVSESAAGVRVLDVGSRLSTPLVGLPEPTVADRRSLVLDGRRLRVSWHGSVLLVDDPDGAGHVAELELGRPIDVVAVVGDADLLVLLDGRALFLRYTRTLRF